MARQSREHAHRKGHWAETVAGLLLQAKGYRILARRYKSPVGEIDLIARRRRRLTFVEVKLRATIDDAAWSVSAHQQNRIIRAAEHWVSRQPQHAALDIAFDVILLAPWTAPRHLQDAFRV